MGGSWVDPAGDGALEAKLDEWRREVGERREMLDSDARVLDSETFGARDGRRAREGRLERQSVASAVKIRTKSGPSRLVRRLRDRKSVV